MSVRIKNICTGDVRVPDNNWPAWRPNRTSWPFWPSCRPWTDLRATRPPSGCGLWRTCVPGSGTGGGAVAWRGGVGGQAVVEVLACDVFDVGEEHPHVACGDLEDDRALAVEHVGRGPCIEQSQYGAAAANVRQAHEDSGQKNRRTGSRTTRRPPTRHVRRKPQVRAVHPRRLALTVRTCRPGRRTAHVDAYRLTAHVRRQHRHVREGR